MSLYPDWPQGSKSNGNVVLGAEVGVTVITYD
jgi:hypothetical protein